MRTVISEGLAAGELAASETVWVSRIMFWEGPGLRRGFLIV